MTDTPAPVGHNNPPLSLEARLEIEYGPIKLEVEALKVRAQAMPAAILTDEDHDKAVALGKDIGAIIPRIERFHKAEKGPLETQVKTIDGFFLSKGLKGIIEPLKVDLQKKDGQYLLDKAEKARAAALAEARKKEAEAASHADQAAALEAEGRHSEAEVHMNAAIATDAAAAHADRAAAGPAKDLARTYSMAGSASLRTSLDFDIDRDTVDLEKLRPYLTEEALRVAIRALTKTMGWKNEDLVVSKADAEAGVVPKRELKGVTFKLVAAGAFR